MTASTTQQPKRTKKITGTNGAAAVAPRVAPRRPPTYRMGKHGNVATGKQSDDLTLKREAAVSLVRPIYKGGPLVFRLLPTLDPEDPTKFAPYRYPDGGDVTDIIRAYSAARSIGVKERFSFLLFDPEATHYDVRTNPYQALWNRIYQAIKRDRKFPRIRGVAPEEWLTYIERGKADDRPLLNKPSTVYFMQGIVFANGENKYWGPGKSPRGLGERDFPQVIQLPISAGGTLYDMMNLVRDEYQGVETRNWEKAMVYGDLVHPKFGRIITVSSGSSGAAVEQSDDTYTVGAQAEGHGGARRTFGEGYAVSITENVVWQGRKTNITAQLPPEAVPIVKKRLVWFDDVIQVLSHEEICVVLAQAFREKPHILYFGWEDHPEFFTGEVRKILKDAKTLPAGAVPAADETDEVDRGEELEQWADAVVSGKRQSQPAVSSVVPDDGDYAYEEEGGPEDVAAESSDSEAGEASEVLRDDEYEDDEPSDEDSKYDEDSTSETERDGGETAEDAEYEDADADNAGETGEDGEAPSSADGDDEGYEEVPEEDTRGPEQGPEEAMEQALAAARQRSSMRDSGKPEATSEAPAPKGKRKVKRA